MIRQDVTDPRWGRGEEGEREDGGLYSKGPGTEERGRAFLSPKSCIPPVKRLLPITEASSRSSFQKSTAASCLAPDEGEAAAGLLFTEEEQRKDQVRGRPGAQAKSSAYSRSGPKVLVARILL